MELEQAIKGRRSVRVYEDEPVPKDLLRRIIEAGTYAPSAKNGQQWRFTVLTGESKRLLLATFREGLEKTKKKWGELNMGSSFNSCKIMEQAPDLIIVWNAGENNWESEVHSVAASIQNMLLMAYSLGLGSLWIADVFYARDSIVKHLGKRWKLIAAVAIGWPTEKEKNKPPPKKMSVEEVSEFLT